MARALAGPELLEACGGEAFVLEQLVICGNRILHAVAAADLSAFMCRHQRCSPRQGGFRSPRAYANTRSAILSSTQRKLSSLIEKLSKSGAGFRKSIA